MKPSLKRKSLRSERSSQEKPGSKNPAPGSLAPRVAAVKVLTRLMQNQGSLATLLPTFTAQLLPPHSAFVQEISYGVCRWFFRLHVIIDVLLQKPLKAKDQDVFAILLIGIYQQAFMRTADHAAIHESAALTTQIKKPWAKALVNAILRNFQRDSANLLALAKKQAYYAHPSWLIDQLKRDWPEHYKAILDANNQAPPFCLRVNAQQNNRETYCQTLQTNAIEFTASEHSQDGVYFSSSLAITKVPGFQGGCVSVQDEAAQLAASLLLLEPGQRVLDACSAPGGKTCHILESQTELSLLALDSEAKRLEKVSDNLQRLQLKAQVQTGDATTPEVWWDGQRFDRILVDAPCSATGIIRRQPDIKLLRQTHHIEELITLQEKILRSLWPLLQEGGILLYATCSILPAENTQLIAKFLSQTQDAVHQPIIARWGIEQIYGRQLFPQPSGHDGFYYARIQKKSQHGAV